MPLFESGAFDDDFEDKLVPEGEYNLRIVDAKEAVSAASGNPMNSYIIRNDDEPDGMAMYYHAVAAPEDHQWYRLIMQNNARFAQIFDIDLSGQVEDHVGATATTGVKIGTNNRNEEINELVLPRSR
jgi:hypothetical protein